MSEKKLNSKDNHNYIIADKKLNNINGAIFESRGKYSKGEKFKKDCGPQFYYIYEIIEYVPSVEKFCSSYNICLTSYKIDGGKGKYYNSMNISMYEYIFEEMISSGKLKPV